MVNFVLTVDRPMGGKKILWHQIVSIRCNVNICVKQKELKMGKRLKIRFDSFYINLYQYEIVNQNNILAKDSLSQNFEFLLCF